uniref:Uncharacterized protein n=1 Tax=Candidatus Kentrum sp. SD TaxID=2126332 RepID=A0A450YVW6_9GAMM|nr:MAG: hypothetical protein BECKSD772F_GA0070984_106311 [Candidatus Kentron sp. SD]VFK45674.1 MAG: hypothetical protein BECKSD772E_GA0070983_105811 [Candidatus Kentron sp. SD]VFK79066.1 MAG: hypothetical protein BECKSD772D_GA0070982_103424 [Candidatus Kentron sp. SD]
MQDHALLVRGEASVDAFFGTRLICKDFWRSICRFNRFFYFASLFFSTSA